MSKIERKAPRIDWITLSWPHQLYTLEEVRTHILIVKDIFSNHNFTEIKQERELRLKGDNCFICFRPELIYFQFHGSFFYTFENYFEIIRSLAITIGNKFSAIESNGYPKLPRLSRLDIAIDYYGDVTPSYFASEIDDKNKVALFRFRKQTFERNKIIETISLISSNSKLRWYRKDIEIQKEQNEHKLAWYNNTFKQNDVVVRFELEINEAKNLKDETLVFYDSKYNEQFLINYALTSFYERHRVRIIQKTKQKSKWPESLKWKSFFILDSEYKHISNISCIAKNDLKMTDNTREITKCLNYATDKSLNWPKTKRLELLTDLMSASLGEAENRLAEKKLKLLKTKEYFLKLVEAVSGGSDSKEAGDTPKTDNGPTAQKKAA